MSKTICALLVGVFFVFPTQSMYQTTKTISSTAELIYWNIVSEAIVKQRHNTINLFLSKLTLINYKNTEGSTLLHTAVENENYHAVQLLLAQGAEAAIKDNAGRTPLALAKEKNNKKLINILRRSLLLKGLKQVFSKPKLTISLKPQQAQELYL